MKNKESIWACGTTQFWLLCAKNTFSLYDWMLRFDLLYICLPSRNAFFCRADIVRSSHKLLSERLHFYWVQSHVNTAHSEQEEDDVSVNMVVNGLDTLSGQTRQTKHQRQNVPLICTNGTKSKLLKHLCCVIDFVTMFYFYLLRS